MTEEILFQNASDELQSLQQQREIKQGRVRAVLGDGNGNLIGPGGVPWVLARLGGDASRLVQAYNGTPLMPSEGMSVTLLMRYTEGRVDHYEIERLSNDVPYVGYNPGALGGVAQHAASHEFRVDGGWDGVNVYERAITSLRVNAQTTPDLTVQVAAGYYVIDGQLYYFAGGNSAAFTAPGSGIRYDVLTINIAQVLNIETGALTLPPIAFALVSHRLPLVAVRLVAGQTSITEDDLFDVRPFLSISDTSAVTSGAFALTGIISPASIGSNQNNYNPTGLSTAAVMRLTASVSVSITGLQGGSAGRLMFVHNIGANTITLKDEDTLSSASNRFALLADVPMEKDAVVLLQYDATDARWRMIGGLGLGTGAGGSGTAQLHGLMRWEASTGQTTFDLPDLAEYVDSVMDNGVELDPLNYSLSADRAQIVTASGITVAHIVTAHYVVAQI